jgi:MATE family multidrug resistance protein
MSILALSLPWLFGYLFGFLAPADSEVLSLGTVYLQIRAFEVPLAMFNAVVWGFLVGRGDSRTPMFLAWIQVFANIVLDWLLVLGNLGFPALGVAGAAIATVIANLLIVLLSAWLLWRQDSHLRFRTRQYHLPSRQELWQIFRVGVPMGLGDFIEVASFTVFVAMIGRLGTDILAANNIALQYMSLSFTMGIAIAQASSSLVAQYLGAHEAQQAERVGYRASYLAMLVMGLIGIGYFVIPEWLMQVFTQEATVIAAGVLALKVVAFYQVIDAVAIVLGGSLNGAGDTTFTMLAKSILAWGFFIPVTWLFTFVFGWGIAGAWVAALVYLAALAAAYLWRFRSGRWKTLQIT